MRKQLKVVITGVAAFAAVTTCADTEYFWRGTAVNPVWDDTSPNWTLDASDASGSTTFVNDYSYSYGSFDGFFLQTAG